MKFPLIAILFAIGLSANSQKTPLKDKKNRALSTSQFYKKNTIFPGALIMRYSNLVTGKMGYSQKDSLVANNIIRRLKKYDQSSQARMMKIRLAWQFKQPLFVDALNLEKKYLKTNYDSAHYYYLWALIFEDRIDSSIARKYGFVNADERGNEWVDWKKMRSFKWADWGQVEIVSTHNWDPEPKTLSGYNLILLDSCRVYYDKAIIENKTEFYFIQELITVLTKFKKETLSVQAIKRHINQYTLNEQKQLLKYLEESLEQEERKKSFNSF